jgi:hypothetical protein
LDEKLIILGYNVEIIWEYKVLDRNTRKVFKKISVRKSLKYSMERILEQYFNGQNFDIRKKSAGYSRFIDQKVTPDVLQFISDCIINYVGSNKTKQFKRSDLMAFKYLADNVENLFNKPPVSDPTAAKEYDKFIGQPLRMLSFAGVLDSKSSGKGYEYKVKNYNILMFIATNPYRAADFLYYYLTKVLKDSGFHHHIEKYIDVCKTGTATNDDLQKLKTKYQQFIRGFTNIRGEIEMKRIFPKIINIIASKNGIPGTRSGRITQHPYYQQDLIYNEVNFRDVGNKIKGVSRQNAQKVKTHQIAVNRYAISRAKAVIRNLYKDSEVRDRWAVGEATHIHHIFPEFSHPQYAANLENLIKLTPTQHNTKAHPSNRNNSVDREYQLSCLLAKSENIEASLENNDGIYDKKEFLDLINAGLNLNLSGNISFIDLRKKLRELQSQL